MSLNRHKLAVGLLAALIHQAGWAQPGATASLLEQGRYWQAQGDAKRAAQAWEKLLLSDPSQQEALYGLGLAAVREKRLGDAQNYLGRLNRLEAGGRYAQRLQQDIALASGPGASDIDRARQLAAAGETDKAIQAYDQALQGREPQGDLALEYYALLGYTRAGMPRAIQGLERLSRDNPGNGAVQLALAKHLIRDEGRRAEGVRLLSQLAQRKDVGADATDNWRAGLLWMGAARPGSKPLFEAYLKQHPDDEEIRTALKTGAAASARSSASAPVWRQDPRLARGFAALKRGDLAAAETAFQEKLRATPNDADALGGLGLVRLQQNKPGEAQELLNRAATRPGAGRDWRRALGSARYWNLLEQAEHARLRGDTQAARGLVEQAIRADGKPAAAYNAMARVFASEGDMANAEKSYRYVLARHKNDPEALRGLVDILAQTNRLDQAQKLIADLTPAQRAELGDLSRLRASALASDARNAEQRGDAAGARALLERANAADPDNPWLTYELARLMLRNGERARAHSLMDGVLRARPDDPDAYHAAALLASEQGDWGKAYDLLARVPANRRNAGIDQFQRRVWLHEQVAQASRMAQIGDVEPARRQLATLKAHAGGEPQLLGAIAQAYVDAGDKAEALALMRPAVGNSQTASADTLLPYAAVLLKSGEDAQAAEVLRQLQKMPLSADQHRGFQDLVSLYTVRQAEATRQRGDLVAAYDILQPVLKRRPDDTQAQGALARMYASAGDRDKAMEIYRSLQTRDPDNAQLQLAVAGIAYEADDWRSAEAALNQALRLAPRDPEILAGAARIYRARGRTGRAAELYQQAIAVQQDRQGAMDLVARARPGGGASDNDNPFVGLPGQRLSSAQSAPELGDMLDEVLGEPVAPATALASVPAEADRYPIVAPVTRTGASAEAGQAPVAEAPLAAPAPAAPAAIALRAGPGTASVAPAASLAAPQVGALPEAATTPGQTQRTLRQELDEVMQDRSAEVRAGVFVRSNNGESGLSKVTQVDTPMEALIPAGDGKVALRVTPVTINAGSIGDNYWRTSRFGGGPVAALRQEQGLTGGPGRQRDRGVGLSAGYEMQGLSADIGVTPLGFEYSNLVGGLRLNGAINRSAGTWYSLDLSRRAVTDSLLSFAGARDNRTDQRWGAVTSNGLAGQIGADNGDYGVYAYGSWHKLVGHNVRSNTRTEAGAGIYWNLVRESDRQLTAGLNLGAIFYDNNQRFYTYGHGGYFSPQQFYALSLPITWAQRSGRFSYKLQGSVGLRHFKEDDANYFTNNSGMQARAASAARRMGGSAVYDGQSRTGIGYNLSAAGEYQLNNHWFLGGSLGMDNASDYRQYVGGLYLRYAFYPMTRPMEMPLNPYQSPYMR